MLISIIAPLSSSELLYILVILDCSKTEISIPSSSIANGNSNNAVTFDISSIISSKLSKYVLGHIKDTCTISLFVNKSHSTVSV